MGREGAEECWEFSADCGGGGAEEGVWGERGRERLGEGARGEEEEVGAREEVGAA